MIEECSFERCSSTESGGAFFYRKHYGQCIQNKICSYNCSTTSEGQYCLAAVNKDNNRMNYFISSTVTASKSETSRNPFTLTWGEQKCEKVNSKNNKVANIGAYCLNSITSNSFANFSNFANNTVTDSYKTLTWHSRLNEGLKCNIKISNCNYVDNPQCGIAIIRISGPPIEFSQCSVLRNTASYTFKFYKTETVTISESYFESLSKTGEGNVVGESTEMFTNDLHINMCFIIIIEKEKNCLCTFVEPSYRVCIMLPIVIYLKD